MRSIYGYQDYREYLKDFYLAAKKEHAAFTYRSFAEKAKLNSPNIMKLIIDGSRNLTPHTLHAFADAIGFTYDERQFFEALVFENQAESEFERRYHRRRQQAIKAGKPKTILSQKATPKHYPWYYPLVLVSIDGFTPAEAEDRVRKVLSVPQSAIARILKDLVDERLILLREGRYGLNHDYFVYRGRESASVSHRRFIEDSIKLSNWIVKHRYEESKFTVHTFSVAKDRIPAIHSAIQKFFEELSAETNAQTPEIVMQIHTQTFHAKGLPLQI